MKSKIFLFLILSLLSISNVNYTRSQPIKDLQKEFGGNFKVNLGEELIYQYTRVNKNGISYLNRSFELKNGTNTFIQIGDGTQFKFRAYEINNTEIIKESEITLFRTIYFQFFIDDVQLMDISVSDYDNQSWIVLFFSRSYDNLTMVQGYMNTKIDLQNEPNMHGFKSSSEYKIQGDYIMGNGNWIDNHSSSYGHSSSKYNWRTGWLHSQKTITYFGNETAYLVVKIEKLGLEGELKTILVIGSGIIAQISISLIYLNYQRISGRSRPVNANTSFYSFSGYIKNIIRILTKRKNIKSQQNAMILILEDLIQETRNYES